MTVDRDDLEVIEARREANPAPACVFQEPGLIERTARDFLTLLPLGLTGPVGATVGGGCL